MKKFISFVMAGAMVASLVPATAFAAKGDVSATAKVIDAKELQKGESAVSGPELQIKIGSADYATGGDTPSLEVELTLDNAEFKKYTSADLYDLVTFDFDVTAKGKVLYGEGSTTYTYEELTTWDDDDFAGVAELKDGEVDEDTLVSSSEFSAETLKGDDARTFLLGKGYSSTVDGLFTTPETPEEPLKASYTSTEINKGIVTKTLEAVVAEAIGTDGDYDGYVAVEKIAVEDPATDIDEETEIGVEVKDAEKDSVTYKFYGRFEKDDKIIVDLDTKLTKTSEGTKATVSVDSKAVTTDDLVFASVLGKGLKASIKKTVDVAEEEVTKLNSNGLKIEAAVGNLPKEITLKISKGFEFTKNNDLSGTGYSVEKTDDNELTVTVLGDQDEITIKDIEIEATSAKSGAIATITAKASSNDSASVEVAKVVDYKVSLSVDEDEDLPVIYSGVNVENDGITDDSEHLSLEVTAEETFPGAWSMRQGFNFNLPEGVYVTNVELIEQEGLTINDKDASNEDVLDAFEEAYKDGDHKNFEFGKRVFDDVNVGLNSDEAKIVFQLELVADPGFEGDVELTFEGSLVETQEVTIAKFVKPYTVKAEQNDLIIDYRNTAIPTPIVITEAEEGLWEKGAKFDFIIDKSDLLEFEDDATFEIDEDSELEVKDSTNKGTLSFTVKEESDSAATVTIKDMELFMQRNIPAGAYDLKLETSLAAAYEEQGLFAPDEPNTSFKDRDEDKESFVEDVCDYSTTVKEAFVNVVTSGRDQDNLFTTKVVVPVGESYIIAGETQITLDTPAYISADGYTMLPVRAVSKALGVDTNNVLWNAETRTVTIMYAQRIISMTVGQKIVYVNGSAIPTSAAPEITNERTFLPLRDLGTALGVTNVAWDATTKTATLN